MDIPNRRQLRSAAAQVLACDPNHRRLTLIWAGAAAVLSLAVSVLTFLLDTQISQTGGLSGMGLRSILSTVQSVLSLAAAVLLPFWNFGYTGVMLRISRRENAAPGDLLHGFRRFGPVLRLILTRSFLCMGVCLACFYVGSLVLSFTPLASGVYEIMLANQSALTTGVIDEATAYALMEAMTPIMILCSLLSLAAVIPMYYRMRLADLRIMDAPGCGALAAIAESRLLLRGKCLQLLKLDLSFWWFYLAEALVMALSYGDVLLSALGITLPISGTAAFFGFYIAALLAQLVLYWFTRSYVAATYAGFYDTLRTPQPPAPAV